MLFQGCYSGDGGPAIQARLNAPLTVAVDGQGNLFISDEANFRIRRVDSKTKVITTVAGTGKGGMVARGAGNQRGNFLCNHRNRG